MEKYFDKSTGESLYHQKHISGLDIYLMPRKGFSSNYAIMTTRYGSIHSSFVVPGEKELTVVPDGIAHYLEHKMFAQPDGTDAFELFSKIGASANAFTSFNMTSYLFSATRDLDKGLAYLLDYVQTPYFTDENVEKERGIIGQEIKMYDDNGGWKLFFNLLSCLYKNNPIKLEIAGTIDSIAQITPEYLYKCYNTFYNLSNMLIFVTGDFDVDEVYSVIDANIKNNQPFTEDIIKPFPDEPSGVDHPYFEQHLDVAKPLFMIGFKDNELNLRDDALLKKRLEVSILLKMIFGKSSALFKRLYEAGLINEPLSAEYNDDISYSFSTIDGEGDDPKQVYDAVIEEVHKFKKNGIDRDTFERVKKSFWGDSIRMYNDLEEYAHNFVGLKVLGVDLTHYTDVFKSITLEDVNARLQSHFSDDNVAMSVVLPKE